MSGKLYRERATEGDSVQGDLETVVRFFRWRGKSQFVVGLSKFVTDNYRIAFRSHSLVRIIHVV